MWLSLSDQTVYFLWSLVFGAALGVLYDLLRAVRRVTSPSSAAVIAEDILYCGICGLLTALFSIPFNNGTVRVFIIIGEGIGFLLHRMTLGVIGVKALTAILCGVRWIFKKISEFLRKFFVFLLKITKIMVYNLSDIIEKLQHFVEQHKKERVYEQEDQGTKRRRRHRRKRRQKAE